jgi:hypothetical protein
MPALQHWIEFIENERMNHTQLSTGYSQPKPTEPQQQDQKRLFLCKSYIM